ncbi:MAG: UDP-N-acetylmuramoyl-L-alanine--D-glutamate ligase [Spirulinaceae cyanobacterium]
MVQAYIIGLGRSGTTSARLLKLKGWEVELSDGSNSPNLEAKKQALEEEGISVKLGHTPSLEETQLPDLLVVSPGVAWDIPLLVEARSKGIDTIGEMELAWRYLNSSPWVGITGTNGKTTTTALTAAIFQAAGLSAPACGNIGYAACDLGIKTHFESAKPDWIIAEISSYQIESSRELAPQIGIFTTLTPDHLKRHYTLENYYNIKANLLKRCQQQIINGDDPYLRNKGRESWPNACWTSIKGKSQLLCNPEKGVYLEDDWVIAFGEKILPIKSLKMVGEHNQQNLLMAVAAAKLAGVDKTAINKAIENFSGVPHRLERICTIAGIDFINDSKATNYDAAIVGLNSVATPAILIAGGEMKKADDTPWLKTIINKAAFVLLIGEAAPHFAARLQQFGYENYEVVETMNNAVSKGLEVAQQKGASVVLLSPACASFDQYRSFEHRGKHFRDLCLQRLM